MADIVIFRTKKVLYRIDDSVAIALIEAGLAERYTKPLPEQKGTTYSIIAAPMSGRLSIACRKYAGDGRVAEETFWSGTPEGALQAFRDIPVSVVEDYRKAIGGETTVGSAEARREREALERQALEDAMRRNKQAPTYRQEVQP